MPRAARPAPPRRAEARVRALVRRARTGVSRETSSARQPAAILRARIGTAQIERLWRRLFVLRGGAEPRDPADVGCGVKLDARHRRCARPMRGYELRARAGN